jgi:small subunit ribosomal protein S6
VNSLVCLGWYCKPDGPQRWQTTVKWRYTDPSGPIYRFPLCFVCAALPPHLSPPAVHGGGNPKEGTLLDSNKYLSPRAYEMMAILLPDQGDEETSAAVEKMLGYITDEQGTVDSVASDSPWGRRRLAYTIRHEGVDYRDGHYVLVYFTAMPSAITEIERELKLDTNVIRYLLLTHDPHMGEQIDASAIDAEGAGSGDETQAETAPTAATEASTETTEDAPAAATEAPVEEAATEAPAEDAAVEETASEEAPAADDTATDAVVADEAATEDVATETVIEETAVEGEVEESAEE